MTNSLIIPTPGAAQVRCDSWSRFIAARIEYNAARAADTPFVGVRAEALSEVARYRDLAIRSEYSA